MNRLVALDIDVTLLEPGATVSTLPGEAISTAVARLRNMDVTVVLASGRMFPGTASVARHLGIDQPLICQQGASVHHPDGSLRHETELLDHGHPLPIGDRDAGALLAAMLQRVEAEVGEAGSVGTGRPDAEHAAGFTGAIERSGVGQRRFQHCRAV